MTAPNGSPPLLNRETIFSFSRICAAGILLGVGFFGMMAEQALLIPSLVPIILGVAILVSGRNLHSRRWLFVLLVHISLACTYFWSLEESHTVTIRVTDRSLLATVDGASTELLRHVPGYRIGFQNNGYDSYRMKATGQANQDDSASLMALLGTAFRMAGPGPAARNVALHWDGRLRSLPDMGIPDRDGSYLLDDAPKPPYTLSFDLLRPEGTVSALVGVGDTGSGYGLEIRFDQPDALWVPWSHGEADVPVGGTTLTGMKLVSSLQRLLRTLLLAYFYALLFLAMSIGTYGVLMALLSLLGPPRLAPWRSASTALESVPSTVVLAVAGVAATIDITTSIATTLLDRVPHVQDSVAYLFQARIFALGRLSVPAPPLHLQRFFAEEFVPFYQDRWFSQYPPGHPLVLSLGVLLGAPWLVGPICTTASTGLLFLTARRIYNGPTALIALVIALTSPFWMLLGSSFMAHPTDLLFITAFLYLVTRIQQQPTTWCLILTGFCAGMLFITRQFTAVTLLAAFVAWGAIHLRQHVRSVPPIALGLFGPLLFLLIYNWRLMGSPFVSTYTAWSSQAEFGFSISTPVWTTFTLPDGLWNTYFNLSILLPHAFGWPYGLALAPAAIPFLTGRAGRWDWVLGASAAILVLMYAGYWSSGFMYGPRYYYEAMPALILLSARGFVALGQVAMSVWKRLLPQADPIAAAFLPCVLLTALLLYDLRFYWPSQIPLYQDFNYSSDAELKAVHEAGISHAIVFVVTDPSWNWWNYGDVFFANNPLLNGDIIYARDLGKDDRILEAHFPGRSHYRLQANKVTRIP